MNNKGYNSSYVILPSWFTSILAIEVLTYFNEGEGISSSLAIATIKADNSTLSINPLLSLSNSLKSFPAVLINYSFSSRTFSNSYI